MFIHQWGIKGDAPGQLNSPRSVAVSSAGEVFVCNNSDNCIQVFDLDGNFRYVWGGRVGALVRIFIPVAIAIHDDLVLVSSISERIECFRPTFECFRPDGTFVCKFSELRSSPHMAVSSVGEVFATNWLENCINVFNLKGELIRRWGSKGWRLGEFQSPDNIAVSPNGEVLVSDKMSVQVFKPDGTFVRRLQLPHGHVETYSRPVAISPLGDIVVCTTNMNIISVFPAGS